MPRQVRRPALVLLGQLQVWVLVQAAPQKARRHVPAVPEQVQKSMVLQAAPRQVHRFGQAPLAQFLPQVAAQVVSHWVCRFVVPLGQPGARAAVQVVPRKVCRLRWPGMHHFALPLVAQLQELGALARASQWKVRRFVLALQDQLLARAAAMMAPWVVRRLAQVPLGLRVWPVARAVPRRARRPLLALLGQLRDLILLRAAPLRVRYLAPTLV